MHEVKSYEYVVIPYEQVRDALLNDPGAFLARELHAAVGPLDVGVEVTVAVKEVKEIRGPRGDRQTRLDLEWRAASSPGLFPAMEATIAAYPLSAHETQLDLHGRYRPPGSVAGAAIDAAVGHRIADESAAKFLKDVSSRLMARLGAAEP